MGAQVVEMVAEVQAEAAAARRGTCQCRTALLRGLYLTRLPLGTTVTGVMV